VQKLDQLDERIGDTLVSGVSRLRSRNVDKGSALNVPVPVAGWNLTTRGDRHHRPI